MTESPEQKTPLNLDPIFAPQTVAVVGASRDRDSIGYAILHNLVRAEFNGAIFPVNPKADFIHSHKAYPSVTAIPDPVDLAVITVPKKIVPAVIEDCLTKGVRGLVVITAGYGETGKEGAEAERRLRDRVRQAGIRMIGPNCMGVINTHPDVRLDATFSPTAARRGSIGFVSQSGALGVAILNAAEGLGIGLTEFISMGNKADVSGNDLIEYWENDPDTRVICMYLEALGNPRRFTEIAKRVGRKKPILIVKSGRTVEGARAASSHTGAIAGTDVTVSAFLEQCGVLRANTIDELFDVARALDSCPLPAGNRVGIVTNAGGPAIMATDACVNLSLEMAEFSKTTLDGLQQFLPSEASVANPVDMIASAFAPEYARSLEVVLRDPGVDMVIVIHVTPRLSNPIDILENIGDIARQQEKPVVAVIMATEDFHDAAKLRTDLPPVFRFPESAARALAQLDRYAAWRRTPEEQEIPTFEVDDEAVATLLDQTAEGYLPPDAAFKVLQHYGIPVARWKMVQHAAEVQLAAADVGYPLVVKAIAPDLVHKSDVGGVALDIRNAAQLEPALEKMTASLRRAGITADGYMVQQMVSGGHEVIFGISTDPRFGPLLMFGLGGRYVEVLQDVRFGVIPLRPDEAAEMVRGIRGYALLEGVRGEPAADLEHLQEILLRIAQLSQRHPRIQELDINPFLAAPDPAAALAVDVRVRVEALP